MVLEAQLLEQYLREFYPEIKKMRLMDDYKRITVDNIVLVDNLR